MEPPVRRPSIPAQVRRHLRAQGLGPRKALGQHFLTDRRVLHRILGAADLSAEDTVIEVGPGLGVLTQELAKRAGRVIAVELDTVLAQALGTAFVTQPSVTVVNADAREVDIEALLGEGRGPYKVVANLPYYAALPILRRFLGSGYQPSLLVVMVQREVAERMTADPGDMSVLSVAVQFYGHPRLVCSVPPSAFSPRPKVTSAVVRIAVRPEPAVAVGDSEAFFHLVRVGFSAPRKQLRNSLAQGLGASTGEAQEVLVRAHIDSHRRAETLSLEEWAGLYRAWALH